MGHARALACTARTWTVPWIYRETDRWPCGEGIAARLPAGRRSTALHVLRFAGDEAAVTRAESQVAVASDDVRAEAGAS